MVRRLLVKYLDLWNEPLSWNKYFNTSVHRSHLFKILGTLWQQLPISQRNREGSLTLELLPKEYTSPQKLSLDWSTKDYWTPLCSINNEDIRSFPECETGLEEEIAWLEQLVSLGLELPKCWPQQHSSFRREVQTPCGIYSIAPLIRVRWVH